MSDTESATAVPRSPVSCRIDARHLHLIQDKPAELGGTDEGMMASEILLSSLLACQLSTFAKVAAKRRSDATVTSLVGHLDYDDAGDFGAIRLEWTLEGATGDQAETLLRLTDKICTVSRALSIPVTSTIIN